MRMSLRMSWMRNSEVSEGGHSVSPPYPLRQCPAMASGTDLHRVSAHYFGKEDATMRDYVEAVLEVIEFDAEDVITESCTTYGCDQLTPPVCIANG